MSIKYAILGILSCNPLTGYDLKKIIQESPFMHWSGNNNQIYKSLVELLDEGFVTSEIHYQEGAPSKKVYTITGEGLAGLKEWALLPPEPPEFKKPFLVQLAWADQLDTDELNTILSRYEHEIKMQIVLQQAIKRRGAFSPGRTPREGILWDMIRQNLVSSHENELEWVKKLRTALHSCNEEVNKMNYAVVEKADRKYIECASAEIPVRSEQDALDLIAVCIENDTDLLMLSMDALTDDFFKLGTGLAGSVLQKFANYRVKTAAVLTDNRKVRGKFREFLAESNRGNSFKVFSSRDEAEKWLLNL